MAENNVHLHDVRHMGATLAAQTGGTTKEVMARLGHASSRAALIYQHAVADRDRAIALALDEGRSAAETRQGAECIHRTIDARWRAESPFTIVRPGERKHTL